MKLHRRHLALLATLALAEAAQAQQAPLQFGVGLFQPDKEKNDATYKPLAEYLAKQLKRPVQLRTVDSWEGLAKSLANGETDLALMGPWGYVLANHEAGAEVVSTILYDGKPEYFAIMVTHPKSGINTVADLKGKTFAFGDKGSTSGYLIPRHYFMTQGIDPERYFSKVLYTKHQAIETQVGFVSEPRILPSRITPDCRLLAVADRWRGPWAPGNPSPKGLKESPLSGRDGGGHHEGAAEAQLLTIARNFLKDVPAA